MNNTFVVGMIVTGVAMLLCIVSTTTPNWWSGKYANAGLFKACLDIRETEWIRATRAMMILSILALASSLVLSILFGCVMMDKTFLALGAAFMSFAAAVLALLGVIIFAAKFQSDLYDGSLHASFGLAIVAVIVAFVAGGILFSSNNRDASIS